MRQAVLASGCSALPRRTPLGAVERQAQAAHPPLELTWTWDTGTTELEGRPDHVFVGPAYRPVAVQVMLRGGSDHRPLRVAIERAR